MYGTEDREESDDLSPTSRLPVGVGVILESGLNRGTGEGVAISNIGVAVTGTDVASTGCLPFN